MIPKKLPLSDPRWWDNLRQLLDDNNDWPTDYLFKFIAPRSAVDELKKVFDGHEIDLKASKRGNYLSLTSRIRVQSSEEVITVYRQAGSVEGVISL